MNSMSFLLIIFVVALIGCCLGFKEFVWFMSVGYGFAIMLIGAFQLIYGFAVAKISIITLLHCVCLIVYGYRLGAFLLKRELNNAAYKKTLDSTGGTKKVPVFVSVFMWLFCSFMYVAQTAPVSYTLLNGNGSVFFAILGLIISACGVYGEALADKQKSAAKARNPKTFCSDGLFKIVRCPNYFSELLVWTGVLAAGLGNISGTQWILSLVGYILIFVVMVNGAQRLEKRQNKNYGNDPEYVKYCNSTPILFPFVPIYHLVKEKN